MSRTFLSSPGTKRLVAIFAVAALAISVTPAFGKASVASSVAKALKLATKANTNASAAKTTANKALSLAQSKAPAVPATSGGPAGPTGPIGVRGQNGANGTNGANGVPGPAGPQGQTGTVGERGIPGPGVTLYTNTHRDDPLTDEFLSTAFTAQASLSLPLGTYALNGQISLSSQGLTSYECQLVGAGGHLLDAISGPIYGSSSTSVNTGFSAAITLTAPETVSLECKATLDNYVTAERALLTALPIGSITVQP